VGLFAQYLRWLHTGWPAGTVEKLPLVREDGSTNVRGLYVVGDLGGIPLLKFSADTGARAVQTLSNDPAFKKEQESRSDDVLDLVILGAGVSGMAAALEARTLGLTFEILEASQPFSTIVNFPVGKKIFTYPTAMVPEGKIQFTAKVKEPLLADLRSVTLDDGLVPRVARAERVTRTGGVLEVALPDGESLRALRVIVAIGRSGNFRKLGVPGEELDKVSNRLHDPKDFSDKDVLIVGGGDSALEAAIALASNGARVSLSYRKPELSRPKPENIASVHALAADPDADVAVEEPSSSRVTASTGRFLKEFTQPGSLQLRLGTTVKEIGDGDVTLSGAEDDETLPNDAVFAMIGREAPLDFFRRSGVKIRGEVRGAGWVSLALVSFGFALLYLWKNGTYPDAFPSHVPEMIANLSAGLRAAVADRTTVIGTLAFSMKSPSFYYTLAYCLVMLVFGVRRIRRRRTPYVTAQTSCLLVIQFLPLFLLPELILPYLGYNGAYESGWLKSVADELFPLYVRSDGPPWPSWGHPRAYWRAYGLILAWPLNIYNVFTSQPLWGWLAISFVQTFVFIPLLVWRWGKGAYCGWICSCGGMAETLGDTHRHKMPHGPLWNRVNMLGQGILVLVLALLALRILGWALGDDSWAAQIFPVVVEGKGPGGRGLSPASKYVSYKWIVDVGLAGILGLGFYFHFSGRVWCRFACPLAALMHIYARFSQFRILADKKKCISCNQCTSVCHQGIDIMSFANKGLAMQDPECVRCSACVQSCPTGVLEFGRVDGEGNELGRDRLAASPVRMREARKLPSV
jgi:NosR/NirI family transcriptional regulator, nitrous oxide reductase regulator